MQRWSVVYKWSRPSLSAPKSCIKSMFKPCGIAFISPPLWLRRLTLSLLLTLVLTHCLLFHVQCISLFTFFSFPPRSHPLWPPVAPHITQLKNVTAVEGSATMISCMADGEPLPDISWRRASDGQTFVDGDKVKSAPLFLSHYDSLAQAEYHQYTADVCVRNFSIILKNDKLDKW